MKPLRLVQKLHVSHWDRFSADVKWHRAMEDGASASFLGQGLLQQGQTAYFLKGGGKWTELSIQAGLVGPNTREKLTETPFLALLYPLVLLDYFMLFKIPMH